MTDFEIETKHFFEHLKQLGYKKVIHCEKCKHWDREDGTFPDIDEKEWHNCELWQDKSRNKYDCTTPSWHYCGWAERADNDKAD